MIRQLSLVAEGLPCQLEEIIPSPVVDGYRNKCEFSIGYAVDGKRVVGFQLGTFRSKDFISGNSSCVKI